MYLLDTYFKSKIKVEENPIFSSLPHVQNRHFQNVLPRPIQAPVCLHRASLTRTKMALDSGAQLGSVTTLFQQKEVHRWRSSIWIHGKKGILIENYFPTLK